MSGAAMRAGFEPSTIYHSAGGMRELQTRKTKHCEK